MSPVTRYEEKEPHVTMHFYVFQIPSSRRQDCHQGDVPSEPNVVVALDAVVVARDVNHDGFEGVFALVED